MSAHSTARLCLFISRLFRAHEGTPGQPHRDPELDVSASSPWGATFALSWVLLDEGTYVFDESPYIVACVVIVATMRGRVPQAQPSGDLFLL